MLNYQRVRQPIPEVQDVEHLGLNGTFLATHVICKKQRRLDDVPNWKVIFAPQKKEVTAEQAGLPSQSQVQKKSATVTFGGSRSSRSQWKCCSPWYPPYWWCSFPPNYPWSWHFKYSKHSKPIPSYSSLPSWPCFCWMPLLDWIHPHGSFMPLQMSFSWFFIEFHRHMCVVFGWLQFVIIKSQSFWSCWALLAKSQ